MNTFDFRARLLIGARRGVHAAWVWWWCLVAAGGVFGAGSLSVFGAARNGERFRGDRILIQWRRDAERPGLRGALAEAHARKGCRVLRCLDEKEGVELVQLPAGADAEAIAREYLASGLVEAAEPDYLIYRAAAPNDPKYADGTQWGLTNNGRSGGLAGADIKAAGGWEIQSAAADVVVAVVDSGVRYTHEDLRDNMWVNAREVAGNGIDDDGNGYVDDVHGVNTHGNDGDPWDEAGHGTHVAGIIGALGNNGKGVAGVAWRVKIMACRFMDDEGLGSNSDAIAAIDYARLNGAQVINASWGNNAASSLLRSAISRARTAGIIFVAAAGNESEDNDLTPQYPSTYDLDNLVSVTSSTRSDQMADFANFGAVSVDLAAPGVAIYSTWNTSDASYSLDSGTSMSAPFVSGAVALLRARFPNDSYRQILGRLFAGTDPAAAFSGKTSTGGRLNLQRALASEFLANFTANRFSGPGPLSVSFQDASVGAVARRSWDFGDGSPASEEENPTHVFGAEGNYTVTLTVFDASGRSSAKSRGVSVLTNYRITGGDFRWIDPAGMTRLTLTDNGVSPAQSMPFGFSFYGQTYHSFYVGANGVISFVSQSLTTTSNRDLPDANSPNALVCPYWDNLNPAAGGQVYFGVRGSAPDRQAVVSWVNVPRNSTLTATLTFQAIFNETSNEIGFQYLEVRPATSRGGGRGATIGVENESGTVAAKYAFDGSPVLLTNNQALVFLPMGRGGLQVMPGEGAAFTGMAGGPFVPSGITYRLRNRGEIPLRWQARHREEWLRLSLAEGTLSPGAETLLTAALTESADALPAGAYADALSFVNLENGIGNTTRTVALEVNGAEGRLSIAPTGGLNAAGPEGGPFAPTTFVYTIVNSGDARMEWAIVKKADWVQVSETSGTLAAGASRAITVSLSEAAGLLPPGTHKEGIAFVNVSNGLGDAFREVSLEISRANSISVSLTLLPQGSGFDLLLNGPAGGSFALERSSDLAAWTRFQTEILDSSGTMKVTVPRDAAAAFYRVVPVVPVP